ncbi:helix-turn-helix domain-containing protein [Pedobacter panaciterrae]
MSSFSVNGNGRDLAEILVLIRMEIERATKKHPFWPSCNIKRSAIVLEEAGELIREANLISEGNGSLECLKMECIQTAATSIRMLMYLYDDETPKDFSKERQNNHLSKEFINTTLIKNVTHLRKSMNLSQREFANRYNISRPTVGAYEEGRASPSFFLLVQISEDTGIDIKTILTANLTE